MTTTTRNASGSAAAGHWWRWTVLVFCAGVLLSPSASAHYHFVRFLSRNGPFNPIPQKFDLSALPNRTVLFQISDQVQGLPLNAPDSVAGLISQIRLAARVWSDVGSADLTLDFGGLAPANGQSNTPGIDVLFTDDLPPGLCGQAAPTQFADPGSNPSFVPITRSVLMLPRNLCGQASYSESFFLTVTHEMGHAIGLQHTFTSGVMSTQITRGTSKSRPLSLDDVAGLSTLYPVRGYQATVGTIAGRVTLSGQGVPMASVVAIRAGSEAISTLSNPDGTYRIEGLPAGQYFVYAHPLPPQAEVEASPGNLVAPVGPDGRPFPFGAAFDTIFFPGSKEPSLAVPVSAGNTTDGINFQVQARARPAIHSVQTYGFFGQVTVKPPTLNRNAGRGTLVAAGAGLMSNATTVTPGLTATPIGGSALLPGGLRAYPSAASYVQLDVGFNPFAVEGPHHIVFGAANDIYVLPSAFQLSVKPPPNIAGVASSNDGGVRTVTLSGTNFSADTRFLFDGVQALVRTVDDAAGRAVVVPPPAPPGHRATVVALNSDGQSSLYLQGSAVSVYQYDGGDSLQMTLSPATLAAGSEAMVEINATGTAFADGLVRLTFASPDITVRRFWIAGPNRLLANIGVAPTAAVGPASVTLANGLQLLTQAGGLIVQPANPRQLSVVPAAVNPTNGQTVLQPGSAAMVFVSNLPAGTPVAGVSATLNDQPVQILGLTNGQLTFVIPPSTPVGPAVFRVRTGTDAALPVILGVDPPPPVIVAMAVGGAPVDASRPVRVGDSVALLVSGLVTDQQTGTVAASRLSVNFGGVDHAVVQVTNAPNSLHQVLFSVKDTVAPGAQPLTVSQDGRVSGSQVLPVR